VSTNDPKALHPDDVLTVTAGTAIINGQPVTINAQAIGIAAVVSDKLGAQENAMAHTYIAAHQIDPTLRQRIDQVEKQTAGALSLVSIKSHLDDIINEVTTLARQAVTREDAARAAMVRDMLRAFRDGDLTHIRQVAIKLTQSSPDEVQYDQNQEERDTNLT
jgi:hypothetical protein